MGVWFLGQRGRQLLLVLRESLSKMGFSRALQRRPCLTVKLKLPAYAPQTQGPNDH
jgi:hypothetical protein